MERIVDDHVIEITDAATQREISGIVPGLRSFNTETTGTNDRRQFAVLARKRMVGNVICGLYRWQSGGPADGTICLPSKLRDSDIDSDLLKCRRN